jgi:hypothetical protein
LAFGPELSMHAALEEQHLFPTIRDRIPEGDRVVREGLRAHRELGGLIFAVLDADPREPDFEVRMRRLIRRARRHLADEQRRTLPRLRGSLGRRPLRELAGVLERARRAAVRPR